MQYTFLKCSTRAQRHNVYFHAPKCSFNLDPIWDQKCNFWTPGAYNGYYTPITEIDLTRIFV